MKRNTIDACPTVNTLDRKGTGTTSITQNTILNKNIDSVDVYKIKSNDKDLSTKSIFIQKASTLSDTNSSQLRLSKILKHQDLDQVTHAKRASLHVATALASSPDDEQAKRGASILNCTDHVRENKDGNLKSVMRCKHRACPFCQQAKQRISYGRLVSSMDFLPPLLDEANKDPQVEKAQILKFTLNMGQACKLSELKRTIQDLHHIFPVFLRRKPIASILLGYMRVTEVTQAISTDDEFRANPHLHGFLLIRGDANITTLANYITKEWCIYISKHHAKRRQKVLTTNSAKSIEPLHSQTREDLLSWAKYMLKGGTYDFTTSNDKRLEMHSTTPEFWRAYDEAIHRQTLISKGGLIASALDMAEYEYQRQKAIKDKYPEAFSYDCSKAIKPTDFIFLKSVLGYAKRSTIELIHRERIGVSDYLKIPNVTGLHCCKDEDLLNEVRSIVLKLSDANSFTLALIALNVARSAEKQPFVRLFAKYNTRTSSHWSEPQESASNHPEDDPNWTPTIIRPNKQELEPETVHTK